MSARQLKAASSGNDLVIEDGNLVVIEGDDSLKQTLHRRLLTVKGGYRYDLSQGVPYFERILGKNPDLETIRIIYRQTLLQHPEVREVKDITFEVDSNRQLINTRILVTTKDAPLTLNVPVRIDTTLT